MIEEAITRDSVRASRIASFFPAWRRTITAPSVISARAAMPPRANWRTAPAVERERRGRFRVRIPLGSHEFQPERVSSPDRERVRARQQSIGWIRRLEPSS